MMHGPMDELADQQNIPISRAKPKDHEKGSAAAATKIIRLTTSNHVGNIASSKKKFALH